MQMSTEFGFAFLCTPKCASTSIETAIRERCNINFSGHPRIKHINAQIFSDTILAFHKTTLPSVNIESFCLIREPLERMESWYRYRTRDALKNPKHRNHKNYTGNINYNDFITSFISDGKKPPFVKLVSQYNFMKFNSGIIGVDHIFPMDRLDLVVDFLSEKMSTPITIPKNNISPQISVHLNETLEEQLRQYLRTDITLYDFVKRHGQFNKKLHSDALSIALKTRG